MNSLLSIFAPPGLSTVALRPYQANAIAAIYSACARGIRRQVLALPTGTGKTVVFVELIRQRGGRALILVHRDELIGQTLDKLDIVGLNDVGVVKAERDEHDHQVVLASVQTLARPNRLARLVPDFETVVVDEAHHAPAETYRRVLTFARVFDHDGPLLLGATATPERADGTGLDEIFTEIVYRRTIPEMVAEGWLCDLRALRVGLDVSFDGLHVRAGDFIDGEVERTLIEANAPKHVLAGYLQHARNRKGLVFTPTVHVAHLMADAFRAAGLAAEAVDASTPLEDRRAMLKRFRTGETQGSQQLCGADRGLRRTVRRLHCHRATDPVATVVRPDGGARSAAVSRQGRPPRARCRWRDPASRSRDRLHLVRRAIARGWPAGGTRRPTPGAGRPTPRRRG